MVYVATFLILHISFSLICAFTTVGARGKSTLEMSAMERKLLRGEATIGDKLGLFFFNLMNGWLFPPFHIASALVYGIYKVLL